MDVTRLTEEEQIALAIQMSMSQADSTSMLYAFLLFHKHSSWFKDTNDVEMKEEAPVSTDATNTQQTSKVISHEVLSCFIKNIFI